MATSALAVILMLASQICDSGIQRFEVPQYPKIAYAAHISGEVQMRLVVGETGTVKSASAITGPPILRSAAFESVSKWLFSRNPSEREVNFTFIYLIAGNPVPKQVPAVITFDTPDRVTIEVPPLLPNDGPVQYRGKPSNPKKATPKQLLP